MVFDRLNELNDRYIELEQRMEQPEVYTDAEAYSRCARELRELEPVITAFRSYQEAVAAMDDARSLMDDPEMRELAQDELEDAMSRRDQLEHELQLLLLPKDPNDSKNVIMEIRGGVGGEEGMLFAHDLYRMYTMYAASKGWEIEVANSNLTELGGCQGDQFHRERGRRLVPSEIRSRRSPRAACSRYGIRRPDPYFCGYGGSASGSG